MTPTCTTVNIADMLRGNEPGTLGDGWMYAAAHPGDAMTTPPQWPAREPDEGHQDALGQALNPGRKSGVTPRVFVVLVGIGMLIVGLLLLTSRISATTDEATLNCGSVISHSNADISKYQADNLTKDLSILAGSPDGIYMPRYNTQAMTSACNSALSDRAPWSWVLVGVGAVMMLGGIVVRRPRTA